MPNADRPDADVREGLEALDRFLSPDSDERVFRYPICHPGRPTGFCFYERSWLNTLRVCFRAVLLDAVLRWPFSSPKRWLLRRLGARIGNHVTIATGAWIDPLYPELLTVEDEVFIGLGARIATHEFRRDEFRAGRVIIRQGAFIGSYALIACGVEIGRDATVSGCAVVGRDVPAGHTAIGNPARIVRSRGACDRDG